MDRVQDITGLTLESWELERPEDKERYFSTDAVIDAYLKGEKDGLEKEQRLVLKSFEDNVARSKRSTNEVYSYLKKVGIDPLGAYIKFDSWDSFHSLIAISENDFVTDDFLNIYDYAADCEDKVNNDLYTINFSFLPISEQAYEKSLWCDGYIFRLNPHIHAEGTRRA